MRRFAHATLVIATLALVACGSSDGSGGAGGGTGGASGGAGGASGGAGGASGGAGGASGGTGGASGGTGGANGGTGGANGGTGGAGSGGTGGTAGTGGGGAPVVVSLDTNVSRLTENQSVHVTASVTHPRGLGALTRGHLTSPDGTLEYGDFVAVQPGSYEMDLSWTHIDQVRPTSFHSSTSLALRAEFFDDAGQSGTRSTLVTLYCDPARADACHGSCVNLATSLQNCGQCGRQCDYCNGGQCWSACTHLSTSCEAVCSNAGRSCAASCAIGAAHYYDGSSRLSFNTDSACSSFNTAAATASSCMLPAAGAASRCCCE